MVKNGNNKKNHMVCCDLLDGDYTIKSCGFMLNVWGIKGDSGEGCCNALGLVRLVRPIPRALGLGIGRTGRTSRSVLWQQNPKKSVLITIITWHFQFQPVNDNILHLISGYHVWSESRVACYSHCYATWCRLRTWIVASQSPSSRDLMLVTHYFTPLRSAHLITKKAILLQSDMFTMNLRTYLTVMLLIMTPMCGQIPLK